MGVLAGQGRRRRLVILGGGIVFVFTLLAVASARSFAVLLAAFVAFYPASGAFVSLTQAEIMDAWPDRQAQLIGHPSDRDYVGTMWYGMNAGHLLVGEQGGKAAFKASPADDLSNPEPAIEAGALQGTELWSCGQMNLADSGESGPGLRSGAYRHDIDRRVTQDRPKYLWTAAWAGHRERLDGRKLSRHT